MKRIHILGTVATIALCLFGTISRAQNTEVSGQLKGFTEKTIAFAYSSKGINKTDTVKVANGSFLWKTTLTEPQQIYLILPKGYYPLFAQAGKMKLIGIKDSVETYKVSGSAIHDENEKFTASVAKISLQEEELYQKYGKGSDQEQLALEEKLDELKSQKSKIADQYIAAHPRSFYSMHLVSERSSYGADYSEVKPLYDYLDPALKSTIKGKALAQRMDILEKGKIGGQMINFTQADTLGNPIQFSSFKGKYVLVDFWASWCGPCRAENPNVLKVYNGFKDKGFTVVGISLDDKAANWKKAIQDDKMPWTQLSDTKGWKNEVSTYYGIQGIPSNFLVDPSGKIVAKDLRGAMLEKKLKELMN